METHGLQGITAAERECTPIETARADPAAFALLYERYVDPIYAYPLHCLHDRAAAEDVVAETFQRARDHLARAEWRSVPVSPPSGLSGEARSASLWLYRLASSAITTHARRVPLVPLNPAGAGHVSKSAVGPERTILRGERRQAVQAALATLPLLQRQMLSLRYGQELPAETIALILGQSTGATKQLLDRARRAVQRRLAAEGDRDG